MEKKKTPSDLVACPVCGKMVRKRGLLSHIRLAHPEVDAKRECAKVIIPNSKGKTLFRVTTDDSCDDVELTLNWVDMNKDELLKLIDLMQEFENQVRNRFENQAYCVHTKDLPGEKIRPKKKFNTSLKARRLAFKKKLIKHQLTEEQYFQMPDYHKPFPFIYGDDI